MPLVDYESSDEENENENENDFNISAKEKDAGSHEQQIETDSVSVNDNDDVIDKDAPIFSELPKPKGNISFLGDNNNLSKLLLNKKGSVTCEKLERESIKISIPSVSEFDDECDQPATKKLKPSVKGVGLFSVLPPPKNNSVKETNRTFIPNAVGKKHVKKISQNTSNEINETTSSSRKENTNEVNDEDDEDISVESSFFGLSEPSASSISENSSSNFNETYVEPINKSSQGPLNIYNCMQSAAEQNSDFNSIQQYVEIPYGPSPASIGPEMPLAESNPLELDEKALQILCGNKKKRQHMPMNIIDLSGEEIMPDSKEWLLKQFTEEKKVRSHSHKSGNGPSSQQRRKHQITYLAYQAKAQELELQNQWANNRMSRRQTQSKYGF